MGVTLGLESISFLFDFIYLIIISRIHGFYLVTMVDEESGEN